jgi:hypothetical protein
VNIHYFVTGVVEEINVNVQKFQGRLTWLNEYSVCTAVLS